MTQPIEEVYLIRHGETEWSVSGQHTGRTDIPLTENGRRAALRLRHVLEPSMFEIVLSSPLQRARTTCELAGLSDRMQLEPDLEEWHYGRYEGLTSEQIHQRAGPGWLVFRDGCPDGESPEQVTARVDRVIATLRSVHGKRAVAFAHGHLLRAFAARWLGLPLSHGACFGLDTTRISILGYYRDIPAVKVWNAPLDTGGSRS
jgi:broad specificity phosphatase PhoE